MASRKSATAEAIAEAEPEAVEVAAPPQFTRGASARKSGGVTIGSLVLLAAAAFCVFDFVERGPKAVVHNPFAFEAGRR